MKPTGDVRQFFIFFCIIEYVILFFLIFKRFIYIL